MVTEEKRKSYGWIVFLIILVILVVLFLLLATWQVPYVIKESYQEQESYYEQVNTNNCDKVVDCSCLHKSWLGLGACDSCNCLKQRFVTRQRDATRYCSALSKLVGNC